MFSFEQFLFEKNIHIYIFNLNERTHLINETGCEHSLFGVNVWFQNKT